MSRARSLWKWTAAAFGAIAVLLAVAVGVLRVWLEHSHALAPQVVARVEQVTGLSFAFAQLDARLGLHGPEFVFRDARITVPGQHDALVTATAGRVGFDAWRSLWTRRLAAGRVVLEGAQVYVYLTPDGVELRGQGALGASEAHLKIDQLPVGRLDDIHDFVAVGFDKSSIDVVRCDCLHGNLPDLSKSTNVSNRGCCKRTASRRCSNTPLNDQLPLEVMSLNVTHL